MVNGAPPRISPVVSDSVLPESLSSSPALSFHSAHNSPEIPALSLEDPFYQPGEHAGHALRRTFSDLQLRKETEVERSLSGQVLALTNERNELQARLNQLELRPTHDTLESTVKEKQALADRIRQVSVNLDNVQEKYSALLTEKQERMANAAISKKRKLDQIADLQTELTTSKKFAGTETVRADKAEQSLIERDARIKELERRLTRQGRELKVANTAVEANNAEKAKTEKNALKAAKSEAKEEGQTIQSLREKIKTMESELREVKGDLNRANATVKAVQIMQDKRIKDAVNSKEKIIDRLNSDSISRRILTDAHSQTILTMINAYNEMLETGGPGQTSQKLTNFLNVFDHESKKALENVKKAYTFEEDAGV